MGTGSFPGVKCSRGVLLTTHHLVVLQSWKGKALPLPTTGPVTGSLHHNSETRRHKPCRCEGLSGRAVSSVGWSSPLLVLTLWSTLTWDLQYCLTTDHWKCSRSAALNIHQMAWMIRNVFIVFIRAQFRTADTKAFWARLGAFAKFWKATVSFVTSVRLSLLPHGTTRFPLDGFSWNLIFGYFSKIRLENSSFIKITREWGALYVMTSVPRL